MCTVSCSLDGLQRGAYSARLLLDPGERREKCREGEIIRRMWKLIHFCGNMARVKRSHTAGAATYGWDLRRCRRHAMLSSFNGDKKYAIIIMSIRHEMEEATKKPILLQQLDVEQSQLLKSIK